MFDSPQTRREQIVAAVLDLLATTPLERLTTRAIAAAVGVSQPALFRHFMSRESLLLAAVEATRGELEQAIEPLLSSPAAPLELCLALAERLAGHVDRHPGLPRLLFADMALEAPELRVAVARLVSMQRTLVAELVAAAVRDGSARADVRPDAAATLFVGMLQGLILQRELGPQGPPLRERLGPVAALWKAAVSAPSSKPSLEAGPVAASRPVEPERHAEARLLDVRPLLAKGVDPLAHILSTLDGLLPGSVLVVLAPFRPKPLEALLTTRGNGVSVVAGGDGTFNLVCVVGGAPAIVDLRDLEPPEPLERVLSLAARLGPGESLLAHLPRHPRWLLPHLAQRQLSHAIVDLCDGSALVRVEGAPGGRR